MHPATFSSDSNRGGSILVRLKTPLGLRFLLVCCIVGYGLRFVFLAAGSARFSPHFGDQHRYIREAQNLLDSGTFAIEPALGPTAFDPPLYAFFLLPFAALFPEQMTVPVAAVQSIVSLLTGWMIAQLTWLITSRALPTRLAFLAWCVYPFAVLYSVLLLSETVYTAALVACLVWVYLLARDLNVRRAAIWGVLLGLTSLTRATANITIPFLFAAVLAMRWDDRGRATKCLAVSGLVFGLILTPWVARNYMVFGRILPGSSQVGRMLYLANNPKNYTGGVLIPRDAQPPERQPGETEVEWNERLGRLAIQFIRDNPGRFLALCGKRLYQFWRITPMYESFTSPLLLAVSIGSYLPLFAFGISGLVMLRRERRLLLPILAVILSTYVLHLFFGVSLRYRFPIEPLMVPMAAYAAGSLLERFPAIAQMCHRRGSRIEPR